MRAEICFNLDYLPDAKVIPISVHQILAEQSQCHGFSIICIKVAGKCTTS